MTLKRKLTTGVGVAIATAGLTDCLRGAVDMAPPAFCTLEPAKRKLVARVIRVSGPTVEVWINAESALWVSASVKNVQGATLTSTTLLDSVPVHPDGGSSSADGGVGLDAGARADGGVGDAGANGDAGSAPDAGTGGGDGGAGGGSVGGSAPREYLALVFERGAGEPGFSFDVEGQVQDHRSGQCAAAQSFTARLQNGRLEVASRGDSLPLKVRHQASIGMLARVGTEVLLEARSLFTGAKKVEWFVSGGKVSSSGGERVQWELPSEPGVYQVELVMDYGDDGVAFDTLVLEVA